MKYQVDLHRTETRTEIIECDSPKTAILMAMEKSPEGFRATEAVELDKDGDQTECHEHTDTCENCGEWIWNDGHTVLTEDDITLCLACARECEEQQK